MATQRLTRWAEKRSLDPAQLTPAQKAAARGHKNEPAERRERRQRCHAKFGCSPERLAKARKEALGNAVRLMRGARQTKHAVDEGAIRARLWQARIDTLEYIITLDSADQYRAGAAAQPGRYTYRDGEGNEVNVLWYGSL
jgi:hypothetical protein